jgi:hypothetical protein
MKDEEVGRVWNDARQYTESHAGLSWAHKVLTVIRKLVEERARRYLQWQSDVAFSTDRDRQLSELRYALRDFGIDPETWPIKPID